MRKACLLAAAVLLTAALFTGCEAAGLPAPSAAPTSAPDSAELDRTLDAQLGLLSQLVTPQERGRALSYLEKLWPLRQERLEQGRYEKSQEEAYLLDKLHQLYERYTVKYLGGGGGWGYTNPRERILAEYRISGGQLQEKKVAPAGGYGGEDYVSLWEQMTAILPEGAFEAFTRFTVFTDGQDETLAYVTPLNGDGSAWEIAVDPADAGDGDWFTETVLHEYCHYLTLNETQVDYTDDQTVSTYNEEGMVARPGSYLDDFYQAFWSELLDDRLADLDSFNFYRRHEDEFLTEYASTDPSEDIAECFSHFVFYDPPEEDGVRREKYEFFFAYPEMIALRADIRARLGLDP